MRRVPTELLAGARASSSRAPGRCQAEPANEPRRLRPLAQQRDHVTSRSRSRAPTRGERRAAGQGQRRASADRERDDARIRPTRARARARRKRGGRGSRRTAHATSSLGDPRARGPRCSDQASRRGRCRPDREAVVRARGAQDERDLQAGDDEEPSRSAGRRSSPTPARTGPGGRRAIMREARRE